MTLKQGMLISKVLCNWIIADIDGTVGRKMITVTLLNDEEAANASWQVINTWSMKYTAPDFNVISSEVATEKLEIAHKGMVRFLMLSVATVCNSSTLICSVNYVVLVRTKTIAR